MSKQPTEFVKQAREAMQELRSLGMPDGNNLFTESVCFDTKTASNIKKADVAKFARAVRRLALAERNSIVIADTDRMGMVVGWHMSSQQAQSRNEYRERE